MSPPHPQEEHGETDVLEIDSPHLRDALSELLGILVARKNSIPNADEYERSALVRIRTQIQQRIIELDPDLPPTEQLIQEFRLQLGQDPTSIV